jgi:predicted PurR-regulated permease PerM
MLLCSGWLFWQEQHGWGIALLVWTVIVGSMDNVMRPLLIKRGIDLPLLVIKSGVIGGLISLLSLACLSARWCWPLPTRS